MANQLIQQKDRLLEIKTPIGKDVLFLTKLDGIEAISVPFQFNLTLASQNSGIEPEELLGKSVTVRINQKNSDPRVINGIINTWIKSSKDSQGIQGYQATIVPNFWFLKLSASCQIFQNISAPQIFTQVCQENNFHDFDLSQLKKTYVPKEYCVQYNETMFDFFCRLLEEEGIYYYFKHAKDKHIMLLSDQSSLAPKLNETIAYKNMHYDDTHIHEWFPSSAVSTNKISTSDYDYNSPTSDLSVNSSLKTKTKILQTTKLSTFYYPGSYQEKSQGTKIVSRQTKAESCLANVIQGSGNYLDFSEGCRFQLQKHNDSTQEGEYFLTKVHHEASDNTHLNLDQNTSSQTYLNHFSCLSTKIDFVPKETTKKPKILSVQSAVVIGPEDKKPNTDKMGRVKVKFFWNQNSDVKESCWIRAGQQWGGASRGIQFIPRVGDEVLVSFYEGNPDRPVIIGSMYNGKNYSPYILPAEQNKSGIRTRTIGVDYKELGNEIYFDDSKSQEKFHIYATTDLNVTAKKNEAVNIAQDQKITIEKTQNINAYKTLTHAAAQEIILTAGKGQIIIKPSEIDINGTQISLGLPGSGSPMPAMPGVSSSNQAPSEEKKHWIQGKYLDANGKPMQNMSYKIIHEDGTTKSGKLNGAGQTEKVQQLSAGFATITFGDRKKLEKQLEKERNQLKQHLDAILQKTKAAAAKEKAYYAKEPWIERIFTYNAACNLSLSVGIAKGAKTFVVGTAKTVAHLFKGAAEIESLNQRENIDAQTGDFKDFNKAQEQINQKINGMLAPIKKGIKLAESLYRDPETRSILDNFALNYYQSETPLMMANQLGEIVGGLLPGIIIAAVTGNPELVAPEVAGEAAADISEVATVSKQIDETIDELKKCKTIESAEVDREHVVKQASPVEEASTFQGSRDYPGKDKFKKLALKKGQIIYAGEPGATGFFAAEDDVIGANFDATKIFQGLQVAPRNGIYRPAMKAYEVLEDTEVAMGRALANPQYGEGGFTQYYISDFKKVTKPLKSYSLSNTTIKSGGTS